MSRKKKEDFKLDELIVEAPLVEEKVEEKPKKLPPEPMITFRQYFRTLSKPPHHRAGMDAYANTKGKRTKSSWEKLFANY